MFKGVAAEQANRKDYIPHVQPLAAQTFPSRLYVRCNQQARGQTATADATLRFLYVTQQIMPKKGLRGPLFS